MIIEEHNIIQVHFVTGKYRVVTAYRTSASQTPNILIIRMSSLLESHGSVADAIRSLRYRITADPQYLP